MTPSQRRRLEAVAAALLERPGCLVQDQLDAEEQTRITEAIPGLFARLHDIGNKCREREGLEPIKYDDDEDLEPLEDPAALAAEADLCRRQELLKLIPPARRRDSCPTCRRRTMRREQIDRAIASVCRIAERKREERGEAAR